MKRVLMVLTALLMVSGLALAGAPGSGDDKDKGNDGDKVKRDAGLVAHYFKDPTEWDGNWKEGAKPTVDPLNWTFREYKYSRIEPLVNHQFIRRGWFSVRWVGSVDLAPGNSEAKGAKAKAKAVTVPAEGVEVKFEFWADDGARLFIDGEKLIDDWRACSEADADSHRTATVKLGPGPHKIVVEYFQGESLQKDDKDPAKLSWSCEALKIPKQIIPAAHFSHTDADLQDHEPSTGGKK